MDDLFIRSCFLLVPCSGRQIAIVSQPRDSNYEAKRCRVENAEPGTSHSPSGGTDSAEHRPTRDPDSSSSKKTPEKPPPPANVEENSDAKLASCDSSGEKHGGGGGEQQKVPEKMLLGSGQKKRVPFQTLSSPKTYPRKPAPDT